MFLVPFCAMRHITDKRYTCGDTTVEAEQLNKLSDYKI